MRVRLSILRSVVLLVVLIYTVLLVVAPASAAPVEQTCGPNTTYVVQRGDTLFRIAVRFGTTYPTLAATNGIANPNRIFFGTTLKIPCANVIPPPPQQPCVSTTYVVQRGDTLFRIATRFGTTFPTLAAANGISNPNLIFPGMTLNIPCVSAVPLPPQGPGTPPIFVDCTKLRATSPRDGLAFGDNTFYWDPVPGVTGYRVNVYTADVNSGNRLVATFNAAAPATNLVGSVGSNAGPGLRFSYEVQALVGNTVVCQTPPVTLFREAP